MGDDNGNDDHDELDGDRFERAAEYHGDVSATYLRMRADELGNGGPHDF